MRFPFFGPAYRDRYSRHVRGGPRARRSLRRYQKHQFAAATSELIRGADAEIELIRLSHPGGGYGLELIDRDCVFVFLTDNRLR